MWWRLGQCSSLARCPTTTITTSTMPKRKVSENGAAKAEPNCRPSKPMVHAKPKKCHRKGKASDRKVQIKEKRGAKGKQADVADQQTTGLPADNGETENQSPASEEEKEANSRGPRLPCTIQRNTFINYFVNASSLVALER